MVVRFHEKSDPERFWAELTERVRKFYLELHPEKTRPMEIGTFAIGNRQKRGEGEPETFNFQGFTHMCGKKVSKGRFTVAGQTIRERLQATLSEVKAELWRRMHDPIPEVAERLRSVVVGHIRYYGVPMNKTALKTFCSLWAKANSFRGSPKLGPTRLQDHGQPSRKKPTERGKSSWTAHLDLSP
jgi:hypothetical protein